MSTTATIATLYAVTTGDNPTPANKAIARALTAYQRAKQIAADKGEHPLKGKLAAKTAFRLAMPVMETREDIRAYIACVAQGLNLEVFTGRDASQMLYAAQVALSLAKQEKPAREPRQ